VAPSDAPLLAAVDMPGATGYEAWPGDDGAHAPPHGAHATRAEMRRLEAILAALPTTEADDAAALAALPRGQWRAARVLEYRIARKRALARTAAALRRHFGRDREEL